MEKIKLIAANLLRDNYDIDRISKVTGLSIEEIKQLKKEN